MARTNFVSVTVTVQAVGEDGKQHQAQWELVPDTLQIEQLKEIDGMPHPIEPEVLLALPMKLKIRGDVKVAARA
jgi:hypothetical protein